MDRSTQEHLHELKKAHTSRLQALEIQAAQFGLDSPAQITTEIKEIEETLRHIDMKLSQVVTPQRFVLTHESTSRLGMKSVGLTLAITAIVFMFWLFVKTPSVFTKSSGSSAQDMDIDEIRLSIDSIYHITCQREVMTLSMISGFIVWHNKELDDIALSIMPFGSMIYMECYDSVVGRIDVILARRPVQYRNFIKPVWFLDTYRCSQCSSKADLAVVEKQAYSR